ncbi:hypothetical protein [Leptolyngbya sp. 7M]|uniref:hypothetical protein n=1 Tax=Leptolyngbya sp. 7M TaxID=2812896 RepID=UPI001B8C6886|nr:hypothetical protein [Leptolyngbya sp. 7M]QYO65740.1 hypothetical protein JVX88_02810 [Leptolyngbya sp. 7M]
MANRMSTTFLLRKLHQLTGIVPLGLFFFVHMFTNSKALGGEANFEKAVQEIHDIPSAISIFVSSGFMPIRFVFKKICRLASNLRVRRPETISRKYRNSNGG